MNSPNLEVNKRKTQVVEQVTAVTEPQDQILNAEFAVIERSTEKKPTDSTKMISILSLSLTPMGLLTL